MSRPDLFELDTWGNHVERVLEVLQCALSLFMTEEGLPEQEDALNRRLLFVIRKENRRLLRMGRGCQSPFLYECRNQPSEEDEARAARESKRPDFTCGFVDTLADRDLFFAIECKRLGRPSSPRWVLNANYVTNGISRFENPAWGYGADAADGAMLGYLQTMEFEHVLLEVNTGSQILDLPPILRETEDSMQRQVTRLRHTLVRRTAPSTFRLWHLWADIRDDVGAADAD